MNDDNIIAYGPVPSRRLGQSLGINNIPPKYCTYSCIYCQVGITDNMCVERQQFYPLEEISLSVEKQTREAQARGENIDYVTFVPDGEPTVDINIGKEIASLKRYNIPIAVITNASLLWKEDVREELSQADWVSVKIDAVTSDIWKKVNRPHARLSIENILDGIAAFADEYNGILTTETMVINKYNNDLDEINSIAQFIEKLNAHKSYISVPTRPPADKTVYTPSEGFITMAYNMFISHGISTECIINFEGDSFAYTGDIEENILGITSVHPIREDAMEALLQKAGQSWNIVNTLMSADKLVKTSYDGNTFYIRRMLG